MFKMRRYLSVLLVLSMVLSMVFTSVPIYKVDASGSTNSTSPAESHIPYDVTISAFDQQTVKGWGVFPAWNRVDWQADFMDKTGAQNALFDDLGVSMFRVMFTPFCGDENGNVIEEKMQEVYDLVNLGHSKGVNDYIVSVWSMPTGMKTINTVNGWTGIEHVKLRNDKEDAYTDFLVNCITWLKDRGCNPPKALSFQNEPFSMMISEWCYWGGDNGAQYQRVAKSLRSKLDAAGLEEVQIIAPEGAAYHENEELLGEGFSSLADDVELYDAIDGFASHSYIWSGTTTANDLEEYKKAADNYPEKDRWQTEYSTLIDNVSDIDMALNAARRLSSDMAFVKNNYWFWWLGWDHRRVPTEVGEVLLAGDGYTVSKSKAFYVLSKIFNHVPVGSKVRRVYADPASGLTTSDGVWMDSVAFVHGNDTVALLVNPSDKKTYINLKGLTGATANVYRTFSEQPADQDMELVDVKNIIGDSASDIELPAKSVTVVITSQVDTAPPTIRFDRAIGSSVKDSDYAVRNSDYVLSGQLDESGSLTVNDVPVNVEANLSFHTTISLSEDMNIITCIATDASGNVGDPVVIGVRYDPQYVGITLDQKNVEYVNSSEYTVSGKINTDAVVGIRHTSGENTNNLTCNTVSGSSIYYSGYSQNLTLYEGMNQITVTAEDGFGNEAEPVTIQVIYDYEVPIINVPVEDTVTATSYVLTGSVNEQAIITVDGIPVNVINNIFSTVVPLVKGTNYITVIAEDLSGNVTQAVVMVLCNPLDDGSIADGVAVSGRTEESIVIDGYLDELKWNINNRVEKVISGQSDNNVAFGSLWDDEYLYIGGRVLDINLNNDSEQVYKDDSIEIYFDGRNNKSTIYGSDDHQITLGWQDDTLGAGNIPGIVYAQQAIDFGYTIEMAIPWSSLGIAEPSVNMLIGFDVGCNDDDGLNAGERDGQLMWHGDNNNWKDTSSFGNLYLLDEQQAVAATKPSDMIMLEGKLNETSWWLSGVVSKNIIGRSDNGVRFGTLCDDDYLYVGMEVLDTILHNDSELPYMDDSIEIYIDANNSRSQSYDTYDHQIILGWNDNELTSGGNIEGIRFAQQDIQGGYSVEIAIPWSGLGITPTRNMTMGFDIGNNDDDGNSEGERDSQLLWNGDGNNWNDTSAFGYVLLHNQDYAAPQFGENIPENLVEFIDDLTDMSKLFDKSANIITVDWEPEKFSGDSTRLAHSNDDVITSEYVTYKSPYGDIYSFEIITGLFDNSPFFRIYGSTDGVDYTQILTDTTAIGGQQSFTVYKSFASNIGKGIKYLMIEFPGGENWVEHLCDVSFKYIGEPQQETSKKLFIDDFTDLNKIYQMSDNLAIVDWEPEKFGGDANRLNPTNDDPESPEYIIYKSPDGDIKSLTVDAGLFMDAGNFKIYGSSDGIFYDELNISISNIGGSSGFDVRRITVNELASGIRYLRVQFLGIGKDNVWKEHICSVKFEYEVVSPELETPEVTPTPEPTPEPTPTPIHNPSSIPGNLVEPTPVIIYDKKSATINIMVDVKEDANEAKVELPRDIFHQLTEDSKPSIILNTTIATLIFDDKAITTLRKVASSGNINISINTVDRTSLTPAIQNKIGDRPVIDFTVKIGNRVISDFGDGKVIINIPYTLKAGEKKNSIIVYYIDNAGKISITDGRYIEPTGTVKLSTKHFSSYAIGYNEVNFEDVKKNTKYEEAIGFLSARGIVKGTQNGKFTSSKEITRADFLIMVMRTYGIKLDSKITDNFDDAGNKSYTPYLATAKRLGIVKGHSKNRFSPQSPIKKEDMMIILYRVLNMEGELQTGNTVRLFNSYQDAGNVSVNARKAVKYLIETGMVIEEGELLNPKSTISKEYVAQLLYELMIK